MFHQRLPSLRPVDAPMPWFDARLIPSGIQWLWAQQRRRRSEVSLKNGRLSKRNRAKYRRRARAVGELLAASRYPRPVPPIVFMAIPAPVTPTILGDDPDGHRPQGRRAA